MGSGCLDGSSVFRYPSLDSGCPEASWELFGLSLDALADRNSQDFFIDPVVELQVIKHLLFCFLQGGVGSVPFLPEELPGSDEGSGVFELPPDDIGPLVELQGQVPMALDPLGVGRVHNGLAGGADGDGLSKFAFA